MSHRTKKPTFILLLFSSFLAVLAYGQGAPAPAYEDPSTLPPTNDPKEIVRRAMETDQRDFELSRNYTYEERRVSAMLDKHGKDKHKEVETYDWTVLYGEPYDRLMQKDDKPLNAKEEQKQQEKVDKFIEKRKNESEKDRKKRQEKEEKERREDRAFATDIANAYDFTLVGEDRVDGRDVYIIDATPRKGFHPTQPHADMLPKLKGRVWIDKKDYGWAKIHVETLDTISWGFFLVRIHKGTEMTFEQTRANHEVWLPGKILVSGGARIALFLNPNINLESDYSNYKKFTTGTRILPGVTQVDLGKEAPPAPK